MKSPLADKIRPIALANVVGQKHILSSDKPLYKIIESGKISNLIFYGPPGTGKTTVAEIIAKQTNKQFAKINGTTAKTADIQDIIQQSSSLFGCDGTLLYIDEIQYLNKKQQQTILQFIENGSLTLVASTTENPYFYVYPAIISRSVVFEFTAVPWDEIAKSVRRAIKVLEEENDTKIDLSDDGLKIISQCAMGDVRKAINFTEFAFSGSFIGEKTTVLQDKTIEEVCSGAKAAYDKDGDSHYNLLSAFQKSIRGSDPDASIHYLARLLESGDIISPARRLLVIASEDIGLAYPMAATIVKSLVDSAFQLGLPEGRIPLAQAVILLATAPKSNSAINAIDAAIADIAKGKTGDIPKHLKDSHYSGSAQLGNGTTYNYPHNFKDHYCAQQYLPDAIKNQKYYEFAANKVEQSANEYWNKIKQIY